MKQSEVATAEQVQRTARIPSTEAEIPALNVTSPEAEISGSNMTDGHVDVYKTHGTEWNSG